MQSRFDIKAHFAKLGVPLDEYPSIYDIDMTRDCIRVHLVDHNELDCFQENLGTKVESIIDHHENVKKYEESTKFRRIEFAGSNMTLILDELIKESLWDSLIDKDTAFFFSAPISLDSV